MVVELARRIPAQERASWRAMLNEHLPACIDLCRRADGAAAGEAREVLATIWRTAAERQMLETLDDEFLPTDTVQLLAAVEDSLTLSADDDPQLRELVLGEEEFAERWLRALVAWPDAEAHLDEAWRETLRREARPDCNRPADWPPLPPAPRHRRRSDKKIARPLWAQLSDAVVAITALYGDLDPDGRILSAADRDAAGEQVRAMAAVSRRFDRARESFSASDWAASEIALGNARSLARNLVLALSDDAERRSLAMSAGEMRVRTFVTQERAQGAGWDEAYARVREIAETAESGEGQR